MSIIIRLENLTWSATSGDIREFFKGLTIPEGGVHIVGGEKGEAFIAFATDEDARLAMEKTGGQIKNVRIMLHLSSRTEMQRVIEQARHQTVPIANPIQNLPPPNMIPAPPNDPKNNNNREKDMRGDTSERRRGRSRSSERKRDRSTERNRLRHSRRERSRSPRRKLSKERDRGRDRPRRDDRRRSDDKNMEDKRDRDPLRDRNDRSMRPKPDEVKGRNSADFPSRPTRFSSPHNNQFDGPSNMPPNVWGDPDSKDVRPPPGDMGKPNNRGGMRGMEPMPQRNENMFNSRDGRNAPERNFGSPQENFNNNFNKNDFSPNPRMGSGGGGFNSEQRNPDGQFGRRGGDRDQDFSPQQRPDERRGGPNFNANFNPPNNRRNEGNPNDGPWGNQQDKFSGPGDMGPMRQGPNMNDNGPFENRGGRRPGNDFKPGMNNMPNEFVPRPQKPNQPGFYIELRNMPLQAWYRNIRDLLRGLYISSDAIKLVHENNRRTGLAFVRLANEKDLEEALMRSGTFLDGVVEITKCTEEAFERARDPNFQKHDHTQPQPPEGFSNNNNMNKRPAPNDDDSVLMLRGLPYNCKKADVINFFNGTPSLVFIEFDNEGKALGTGFVVFSNYHDQQVALGMNRKKIGHRYIELSISSKEIMSNHGINLPGGKNNDNFPNKMPRTNQRGGMTNNENPPPFCISMNDLPKPVSNVDVQKFFAVVGVTPVGVHVCIAAPDKDPAGGDALVEFGSQQDFEKAMSRNGSFMDNHQVSLTPIPFQEMVNILESSNPNKQGPPFDHPPNDQGPPSCGPDMDHRRRPMDRPMDIPWRPDFQRGNFANNGPRGPRGQFNPRPDMRMGRGQMQMAPRRPPPIRQNGPPLPQGLEGFGSPGCVLGISGIPTHAGVSDILNFIKDYNCTKDNILRRFDDHGKPTGDARIAVSNPQEASRAIAELNNQILADSPVSVFLA